MCHRKENHPSHKKCRYYLKGECHFSSEECWYIHEDSIKTNKNIPTSEENICVVCQNTFPTNYDLLEHNRRQHFNKVPSTNTQTKSTTVNVSAWDQPLSSMSKEDFHQIPPIPAPDQLALLKALEMLNQRLHKIETRMFQQLI